MITSESTGDRISELPDEILHRILRRTKSTTAVQTIALSRRWRDIWHSYPIVNFAYRETLNQHRWGQIFEKFCDSTIERFSQDSLLSMESLSLNLWLIDGPHHAARVYELLDLASERKAEKVKLVNATQIRLDSLSKSPNSLRSLHLRGVQFNFKHGDEDFSNLIASSPLLETLELVHISGLRKLEVCNCTDPHNLKTLTITSCHGLRKIEIAASGLRTLKIQRTEIYSQFELTAPRLSSLKISNGAWKAGNLEAVISKLPSLKSLTLADLYLMEKKKKLKLSSPKLEEFTLHGYELEEIELDAGPSLAKFLLRLDRDYYYDDYIKVLKKCEISPACRWEVDIVNYRATKGCLVELKSLLARFTNFSTVNVVPPRFEDTTFDDEELDHTLPPVDIKHLIISKDNEEALLDGLLWAMHPELLSITDCDCSDSSFLNSLKLAATTPQPCHGRRNWRHQLKDVRIVNRNIDRAFTGEIKQEETISLSEYAIASLAGKRQVCFMLIWR